MSFTDDVATELHRELEITANAYGTYVSRVHALGLAPERLAVLTEVETRLWQLVKDHAPVSSNSPANPAIEALQARADYNRDNAGELFTEALYYGCTSIDHDNENAIPGLCCNGDKITWRDRATLEPVVFTPYGWRLEKEIVDNATSDD